MLVRLIANKTLIITHDVKTCEKVFIQQHSDLFSLRNKSMLFWVSGKKSIKRKGAWAGVTVQGRHVGVTYKTCLLRLKKTNQRLL